MVHWNIEETLLLVGMQVHGDKTVNTGNGEHVCNQLGSDAYTWLALAVLACPAEVGYNGIYSACRCTLGSINHQQHLHEVVCIGEGALYQIHILAADALFKANLKLTVCKTGYCHVAQLTAQAGANLLGQITCCCAGEYFE